MRKDEALMEAALALRILLRRAQEADNRRDAYAVEQMGGEETVLEIIQSVEATATQYSKRRRRR